MAKKKYYAVKLGYKPGVYTSWSETQEQVSGFSGAVFKSFSTIEEAEDFLITNNDSKKISPEEISSEVVSNQAIDKLINNIGEKDVISFVDGSYKEDVEGKPKVGFGAVLITNDAVNNMYKAYIDSESIKSRNVSGEIYGARESILWSIKQKKENLTIFYDYEGIEKWATGEWGAKSAVAKDYKQMFDQASKKLNIEFVKVKAHSGIEYNELADELAKRALLDHGYKTYDDGSVYFTGFNKEDWMEILKNLNISLEEPEKLSYKIEDTDKKYLKRIKVSYEREKVTINCYTGAKSYVQGKQTFLLENILSHAIEHLPDNEAVIEVLNNYHAVTVDEITVEENFSRFLPDFPSQLGDIKLRNTLYNAVFNTMLIIDLPDYTFLVTPLFRAYEYYLHKILNKKLGKTTEKSNGSNNFSFFSRVDNNPYYYNGDNGSLSTTQIHYLNDLYNEYNQVRHIYSHWPQSSFDAAMIPDLKNAQNRLENGLTLINKYYKIF